MQFLPGGSLANRRLRDGQGVPQQNPAGMLHLWLPAVAAALDFVHAQGVIHRDVKPGNIFFDAFWNACLGDFGIAKILEDSQAFDTEHTLTATNMGVGTPEYMAPEYFIPQSAVDGRADQYALAVTAYELLAATRPFSGTTAHLVVEVTTQPVPPLDGKRAGLPSSLVTGIHRGLAKRAADRFSTCREFAAAVLRDVPTLMDENGVARLLCPGCSTVLKLPTTAAGKEGKCPRCRAGMKVAADLGALWMLDEVRQQLFADGEVASLDPLSASIPAPHPGIEPPTDSGGSDAFADFPSITTSWRRRRRTARRKSQAGSLWLTWGSVMLAFVVGGLLLSGTDLPKLVRDLPKLVQDKRKQKPVPMPPVQPPRVDPEPSIRPGPTPLPPGLRRNSRDATPIPDSLPPALPEPEVLPSLQNSLGIEMKLIPAGEFVMGSRNGRPNEQPARRVIISRPFYLAATEVTNRQWQAVMGAIPGEWKDDDLPVQNVTHAMAVSFCEKLSDLPEERSRGHRYRLPTEAEWEYACRAKTNHDFSSREQGSDLKDTAWFRENAGEKPNAVGKKEPNLWGLHDMHGNVWEWCSDWYGPFASPNTVRDPSGPSVGKARVFRGGGWCDAAEYCRCAARSAAKPSEGFRQSGLRVAMQGKD
jgi:formylglycine-generating enzyme required for sulfatase activity